MNDQYEADRLVIARHETELVQILEQVAKKKGFINTLLESIGEPKKYAQEDERESLASSIGHFKKDEFTGKATATAVEEFLNMRQKAGLGAASLDEIFDALSRGGFEFRDKDGKELRGDAGKKNVAITLGKNTQKFRKINNPAGECFGLQKWYGGPRVEKKGKEQADATGDEAAPAKPAPADEKSEDRGATN